MNEKLSDFIEIINNAEDVINGGWKTEHEPVTITVRPEADFSPAGEQDSRTVLNDSLETIAAEISRCRLCGLSAGRTFPVPGAGVVKPVVMFIGEGPGEEEDKCGIPIVGKAGQYLDKWLDAIGLEREKNCFIGNIIKCRPPNNRDPKAEEIAACRSYLSRQLLLIKPVIIVTLGRFASQWICRSEESIGRLRGRVHSYQGIPVIPTYHPSAVLKNQELRGAVWSDLKRVKELADEIRQSS